MLKESERRGKRVEYIIKYLKSESTGEIKTDFIRTFFDHTGEVKRSKISLNLDDESYSAANWLANYLTMRTHSIV